MYLTRGSIPVCLFSLSTLLTLLYYSAKCLRSSNAHPRQSWSSEHTSLKPFTYPVPETRFLHAGVNVYKFKIKYGNTTCINTDLQEGVVNEELQDAIRIILGNLDNLCPFTTEHLTIFPYLNKWERVSDLRFMHGDAFLTPYPYVCTVYVESKSWKQNVFGDKTKNTDVYNSVNRGSKLRETVDTERAIKWGRWEDAEEISHTRVHVDRNVAKSATHDTSKSNYNRCSSARVGSDYDNRSVLLSFRQCYSRFLVEMVSPPEGL
ncbi:membrane-anchored junction protein isoform X7 [Varanus komodoensis]|uniref:membrane-anchored junction protein isoform X7 n=1 Tax=Varanus komodoensis TaxID=61221 RepID=UPI001CF7D7B6|nr:membrane-anchored junction protein isoform X7 [Varanus komodoensis]